MFLHGCERRTTTIYIVCFWGNFFVNQNINGDLITIIRMIKGIACHTNTYMQLYTLHIGWLYLGN